MKTAPFTSLALTLPLLVSAGSEATPRSPGHRSATPVTTAQPQKPEQLLAAVRLLLDGYEPLDVERGMKQLGAPAADVLLRLLSDRATPALIRLRAIEALGYVPTPAGRTYLRNIVSEIGVVDDERVYTLAAALRALGAFGPAELPGLALFLSHGSADVREAAAAGLAAMNSESALPALKQRLTIESDSGVKETLKTAIRRLAAAQPAHR